MKISKYDKFIDEAYTRTVGFRYSDPKIGFNVEFAYKNPTTPLTVKNVEDVLSKIYDLKYDSVCVASGMVNSKIIFNFYVYNEREIDSILNDFGNKINVIYNITLSMSNLKQLKTNF